MLSVTVRRKITVDADRQLSPDLHTLFNFGSPENVVGTVSRLRTSTPKKSWFDSCQG